MGYANLRMSMRLADARYSACECRSADQPDLQEGEEMTGSTPVGYGVSVMMRS